MCPSLIFDVRSATSAITGNDSCQRTCESYVHPYSKPRCSATCMSSISRVYGGSGRTVTPKLSGMEPPVDGSDTKPSPSRSRNEDHRRCVTVGHEPPGYDCPFCRLLRGVEPEHNTLADIVSRDERTCAFISPKWWAGNPGHAIVIPVEHVENLYEIEPGLLGAV